MTTLIIERRADSQQSHMFQPDDYGLSCLQCELPGLHRVHIDIGEDRQ